MVEISNMSFGYKKKKLFSGLGLTLARQIARAHSGEVVYEPREGGGSCFTLRLPVTPSAKSE